MHKKALLSIFLLFAHAHCMDLPLCQQDSFSEQSNIARRIFIFPMLTSCEDIEQAREIILSIALVSKKSYAQMMCPSFVQGMLKVIGNRFILSDSSVAHDLDIPAIEKYAKLNKELFRLTYQPERASEKLLCFKDAINFQQASVNFTISEYHITLLMRGVYENDDELTEFLLEKGADYNACAYRKIGDDKRRKVCYVRDCNMIYNNAKLSAHLNPLYDYLFPHSGRESSSELKSFLGADPCPSSYKERLNFFRQIYKTDCNRLKKAYEYFCQNPENKPEFVDPRNLYTALCIDSSLEKKGAHVSFKEFNHPLIGLLTRGSRKRYGFVYQILLCTIFNNDPQKIKEHAPMAIAKILCDFMKPEESERENVQVIVWHYDQNMLPLTGSQNPNFALICAVLDDPLNLPYIHSLFECGADPNFKSHIFDTTPLMRAVRVNRPVLVKLLLEKGANVHGRDADGKFVRSFNLIYSSDDIKSMINSITNRMLQIETHNKMHPDDPWDCLYELSRMPQARIICDALSIDALLERRRAYADSKQMLLKMLGDSRVKRALSYVLHGIADLDIPEDVRSVLRDKKIPRSQSSPF